MWRRPLLMCVWIPVRLCAVVISPLVAPGIPKSSVSHFSFYMNPGCDESEMCLLSPGVFRGMFSLKGNEAVTREYWASFPVLGVWISNTSFMIVSLDLFAMFLLIQLRVQLIFAARQTHCSPGPPGPVLQSCFLAPACPTVWDCPSQRQGFAFELQEVPAISLHQGSTGDPSEQQL